LTPTYATPSKDDVLDYVPRLAAPRKYRRFAPHLERIRHGVEKKDLDQVVEAYSYLSDWLSTDQLTLSDWEQISELLSSEMSLPLAPAVLSRTYHQQPEKMGWLSTLAIEAAVRDHWAGLYQFFLSLITAGRPQLVVNAYERYRDGLQVYQGKIKEDLHSWNRTKRLAARTSGEGIKPISTVHLAALTMLDKIQPANLTAIFGTDTNWMWIDHSTRRDVIRAYGKGHDARVLSRKFDEGVDKFLFAILCHHPATMADRLVGLRNSNSREQFFTLYQRILDWSIGPDRILRPLDLDTKGGLEIVKDIVIPQEIWCKFSLCQSHSFPGIFSLGLLSHDRADLTVTIIQCLTRFSRPEEIERLIERELPARGLTPSPAILAQSCIAFALIGNESNTAEATRKLSQRYGQELWTKYIEGRPIQQDDNIVAAALHTRYMYSDHNHIHAQYQRLAASRTNIGPLTRSALIHILFSLNQVSKAVEVLKWTMGYPEIAIPSSPLPYATFVRTYLRRPPKDLSWVQMAQVLESRPKYVQLSAVTRALMATAALAWSPISAHGKLLETLLNIIGKGQSKYMTWRVVLGAVLTHNSGKHSTTDKEARMGLALLRAYIAETSHIQTQSRSERLWQVYLRQITHSLVIGAAARQRYLLEAVSIIEDRYGRMRKHTMYTLVEAHLSRRHRLAAKLAKGKQAAHNHPSQTRSLPRSDDIDVKQAMYWFRRMRGIDPLSQETNSERLETPISDAWWTRIMYALINARRVDAASLLVAEAWNQEQVPLWAAFWDEARDSGVLAKAGIGEEDLEEERKLLLASGKIRKRSYVREQGDEETLDDKEEQLRAEEEMESGQRAGEEEHD